jgi:hypothetical protein
MPVVLFLVTALVFAVIWHRVGDARVRKTVMRVLGARSAPMICGAASSLLIGWIWSGSRFAPGGSDESAYVLQAQIFAAGEWKLPPRPYPEFFEQEHTFVFPFVAAKYPPGHSLVLTPGVWLGFAPIVPLILVGVAGGLTFFLSRKLSSGWVALLTWAIWLTMPLNFIFLPDYFSELTTLVLWLLGWLAVLNRSRGGRAHWVVLVAACVAWGLITRPLTGAVYAVPVTALTLYGEWRRRALGGVLAGLGVGVAILSLIPLWSWRTTGDWSKTPLTLYAATYIPWDVPGFGFDATAPTRTLPADIARDFDPFHEIHRRHIPSNLPSIAWNRFRTLAGAGMWAGWRVVFSSFLLLGLVFLPRVTLLGAITSVLLFAAYLAYAANSAWPLYYLETMPVAAFVTAVGIRSVVARRSRLGRRPRAGGVRVPPFMNISLQLRRLIGIRQPVSEVAIVTAAALCVINANLPAAQMRRRQEMAEPARAFQAALRDIPTSHNLVFVQFPDSSREPYLFVRNDAFLDRSRNWLVFDRGDENVELRRLAPNRVAYRIEASTAKVTRLP